MKKKTLTFLPPRNNLILTYILPNLLSFKFLSPCVRYSILSVFVHLISLGLPDMQGIITPPLRKRELKLQGVCLIAKVVLFTVPCTRVLHMQGYLVRTYDGLLQMCPCRSWECVERVSAMPLRGAWCKDKFGFYGAPHLRHLAFYLRKRI